ncbi:sulfated surface glycoprotein 185-like [Schistocerca americana]|uniref:sulfated surface glycoprotein 185-like n=1 Tax=Schistocerca americana TaxID=7009 RepID=UPI001F4F6E97|nr:sulfated surface glycoprotein 185-like [Schistocerca americana]
MPAARAVGQRGEVNTRAQACRTCSRSAPAPAPGPPRPSLRRRRASIPRLPPPPCPPSTPPPGCPTPPRRPRLGALPPAAAASARQFSCVCPPSSLCSPCPVVNCIANQPASHRYYLAHARSSRPARSAEAARGQLPEEASGTWQVRPAPSAAAAWLCVWLCE